MIGSRAPPSYLAGETWWGSGKLTPTRLRSFPHLRHLKGYHETHWRSTH